MSLSRECRGFVALITVEADIGGIGITLNNQMNGFAWANVTVILIAIFAVVMASEWVSAQLRRRVT